MPDAVDAPVDAEQHPNAQAVAQLVEGDPCVDQLPARDDAVLPCRYPADDFPGRPMMVVHDPT